MATVFEAMEPFTSPILPRRHWIPRNLFVVVELLAPLMLIPGSMLASRFDPSVALFCVTLFALLTSWKLAPKRLTFDRITPGTLVRRVWPSYAFASALSVGIPLQSNPIALLGVAIAAVPFLLTSHGFLRMAERALRGRQPKKKTLIVGGGEVARRLISVLAAHDEYGLEVVGAVDDDPKFSSADLGVPLLGDVSDLSTLVRATKSEVLIVAYSSGDLRGLVDSLRDAMAEGAKVWVVPRLFGLRWGGPRGDYIWGLPVLPLKSPAAYRPQWALKRLFDLALTVLGVFVLSPVLLLIAAAIYFDLGRPILYRQRRITRGGRAFEMLKFRTMRLTERHVETTQGVRFMMANSQVLNQNWLNDGVAVDQARMTRLGTFLRSSSLDELPQLLNVLKGDMSLVGPRPERPHFAKVFSGLYPEYRYRHRLPAGLTGWAQIHGLRGDTSIEERAAFDNYYIENWSLSRDVRILLRTVVACLPRRQRST